MNFAQLFGKKGGNKKEAKKVDNNEQNLSLLDKKIKEQELRLKNIETKINALQKEAKEKLKAGNKSGARRILSKKKKYVDQLKQIEGVIYMMEEQKFMIENAAQMNDVIKTIKKANETIKNENIIKIEELEDMKADMDELKDVQKELGEFFKEYGNENLEEVNEELEELEKEMADDDTVALPGPNKEVIQNEYDSNKNEEMIVNFLNE